MPPNVKGGKGYRKGKHSGVLESKILEWDEGQGQMLGRTMKKLGDRRFRIFCNDNKERICKLVGGMRKSDWVDEGVIVLIGVRELGTCTSSKGEEVADILAVVEVQMYGRLKKQEGVNQLLFTHVENEEKGTMSRKIHAQESGQNVDDDVFEREGESDSDKDTVGEETITNLTGLAGEEQKKLNENVREEKRKTRDQDISMKRSAKRGTNNDVDIDNL